MSSGGAPKETLGGSRVAPGGISSETLGKICDQLWVDLVVVLMRNKLTIRKHQRGHMQDVIRCVLAMDRQCFSMFQT